MIKTSFYTFLIASTLLLTSCSSEINNENILGTWTVTSVEVISDNSNFSEADLRKAEKRIMTFSYIFMEDDNLETLDGARNLKKKGGNFILDEKRKVLTINEAYNGLQIAAVLWTIEASTSETMTLFQDTPGKSTTRMSIVKSQ